MRRYATTLILLVLLLAAGGWGIYRNVSDSPQGYVFGYPLTPLSADATEATTQALILVAGGGALLVTLLVMGAALAFGSLRYTAFEKSRNAPASAGGAAGPAARSETKGAAPGIPLSGMRSLTIFWIVLIVLGVGFMVIRNWGVTFGYFPTADLAKINVFRLPGTHIEGLPAFIAGPGDYVTALQLLIGALGFAVVGTAAAGVGLALGTVRIDQTLKTADKLPRTPFDRALAYVLYFGKPPADMTGAPPRPAPLVDRILMGLDAVLVIIILVAVAAWAIPTLTASPTPVASDGAGGNPLEAEFAALPAGNADAGKAEFDPGGVGGCGACHALEADKRIVGPSLAGIAPRAATRKPGYSAELYLYESVTNPNAYVLDTFQPDLMPQNFKEKLTPQQLADVIAFLLTQK